MTMRLNKEEFKINTNSVAFKLLTEKYILTHYNLQLGN